MVLGHEGAGVVQQIGEGVSWFAVGSGGDTYIHKTCGKCEQCLRVKLNLASGSSSNATPYLDCLIFCSILVLNFPYLDGLRFNSERLAAPTNTWPPPPIEKNSVTASEGIAQYSVHASGNYAGARWRCRSWSWLRVAPANLSWIHIQLPFVPEFGHGGASVSLATLPEPRLQQRHTSVEFNDLLPLGQSKGSLSLGGVSDTTIGPLEAYCGRRVEERAALLRRANDGTSAFGGGRVPYV
ncbi:hypothetical protein B0H17DRAFT_1296883 [Mycena rosella]|uniref:Alcohol dehydrogenase-like N-terminal domain-containing protein n=1 Tax=Mycena rosella TaxID=1033263 RepID=A0AAD7DD54_MYCRO|nr:hypothetical protein B0H17DRAFT_1296883 [Mycena rosella]